MSPAPRMPSAPSSKREATAFKASTKSCEAKNAELAKVGSEILERYEAMNPLEAIAVHEPVFGLQRVEHQNLCRTIATRFSIRRSRHDHQDRMRLAPPLCWPARCAAPSAGGAGADAGALARARRRPRAARRCRNPPRRGKGGT